MWTSAVAVPPSVLGLSLPDWINPVDLLFEQAAWAYVSLLLAVVIFVRFDRLTSLRNWDILTLFGLVPGFLMLESSRTVAAGIVVLISISGSFALRAFVDVGIRRRPSFQGNLAAGAAVFLLIVLVCHQALVIWMRAPDESGLTGVYGSRVLLAEGRLPYHRSTFHQTEVPFGPAYYLLHVPVVAAVDHFNPPFDDMMGPWDDEIVRFTTLAWYLLTLLGLWVLGARRFRDWRLGLAMAVLLALLPYSMESVHKAGHIIPAALVVWGLVLLDRAPYSGTLLAVASSAFMHAVALFPLWLGFHRTRRWGQFVAAYGIVLGASLWFATLGDNGWDDFIHSTFLRPQEIATLAQAPATTQIERPVVDSGAGAASPASMWGQQIPEAYRLVVVVGFLLVSLLAFMMPKRFHQVVGMSVVLIVGWQFVMPHHNGQMVWWYLPLLVVMIMRPTLPEKGDTDPRGMTSPAKPAGANQG